MGLEVGTLKIEGKERTVYEHAGLFFYYNDYSERKHINEGMNA